MWYTLLDSKTTILAIGQRVHCILYGGKDGIVTAIHGAQSPGSVGMMAGGAVVFGGAADFEIQFEDHVSRVPESIVRGVQWRIYDSIATAEEIAESRIDCAAAQRSERLRGVAAEDQFQAAVSELRANPELTYLEQIAERHCGGPRIAPNIRKVLKKHFPGVKFSVRSDYNTVRIGWQDGPTSKQVEALVDRFQYGNFDGMDDSYKMERSPWCEVFGGCKYIFAQRSVTRAAERAAFFHHYPHGLNELNDLPEEWYNLPDNLQSFIRPAIHDTAFKPAPDGITY